MFEIHLPTPATKSFESKRNISYKYSKAKERYKIKKITVLRKKLRKIKKDDTYLRT